MSITYYVLSLPTETSCTPSPLAINTVTSLSDAFAVLIDQLTNYELTSKSTVADLFSDIVLEELMTHFPSDTLDATVDQFRTHLDESSSHHLAKELYTISKEHRQWKLVDTFDTSYRLLVDLDNSDINPTDHRLQGSVLRLDLTSSSDHLTCFIKKQTPNQQTLGESVSGMIH